MSFTLEQIHRHAPTIHIRRQIFRIPVVPVQSLHGGRSGCRVNLGLSAATALARRGLGHRGPGASRLRDFCGCTVSGRFSSVDSWGSLLRTGQPRFCFGSSGNCIVPGAYVLSCMTAPGSNSCCSECAGRVLVTIRSPWRRIAERLRWAAFWV